MKRWQDAINVAGGLWLMVSPWLLRFAREERAVAVTTILGAALLAAALGALTLPRNWEKCDEVLVGLAAVGSPWMIGLQAITGFFASTLVVGTLAILMAGLSMLSDRRERVRGACESKASDPGARGEPCRR